MGRKISWQAWARLQAIGAAGALGLGGIMGLFYPLVSIAAYGLVIGIMIYAIERPVPGIANLGNVIESLWFRAFAYFLLAIPCLVQITTVAGGTFLISSSVVYFVAARSGERWKNPNAPAEREEGEGGGKGRGGDKAKEAAASTTASSQISSGNPYLAPRNNERGNGTPNAGRPSSNSYGGGYNGGNGGNGGNGNGFNGPARSQNSFYSPEAPNINRASRPPPKMMPNMNNNGYNNSGYNNGYENNGGNNRYSPPQMPRPATNNFNMAPRAPPSTMPKPGGNPYSRNNQL